MDVAQVKTRLKIKLGSRMMKAEALGERLLPGELL